MDSSRQRLEGVEPIAIVGIGCRMPGQVRSPGDLWKVLMSKTIANAKVPKTRFNIDAFLHPSNERPGSFNVPGGYFLDDDLEGFDPRMFKISPPEALWMDPQQRKLLEVVYEAFENSGTPLEDIAGQRIGCFVGSFTSDYQQMATKEPDFRHIYAATGVDTGMLGSRISYAFDLKGPSLIVNTACSSSLYALDLACKAISAGQCEGAIVGGANLILTVDQHMDTARMGVLSPTDQCHAFDKAADGYGRAEGVGALYIKPLKYAIEHGDPIRAVIRSTATSSNGKCKDGMTHPSVQGQVEVITMAYKLGNITPDLTSYVECHGTGTPVGDPIEVEAIHEAMGAVATRDVLIGSVKPNVGHSEAASSMATLIKAILALENGIIPPTAGITTLNPAIPWDRFNVNVVTEPTSFPTSLPVRRIGVNAFGYGGTNAHAVLEGAQSLLPPGYRCHKSAHSNEGASESPVDVGLSTSRPYLLLFSAHDEPTLKNNMGDYSTCCHGVNLIDLSYTLALRRTTLEQRSFAVVRRETAQSDIMAASRETTMAPGKETEMAFVFTGQGAQWPQMGMALLELFPVVLQTIKRLDRHLSTLAAPPSWNIETIMTQPASESMIYDAEYSQPLCTAVQIALVDLLTHWGVRPSATIGHSSGEIGAAYAAGKISAESAITIAYFRGKVAASLRTDGAMLAVGLGADKADEYIQQLHFQDKVVVAARNSPDSVTLSGDRDAVDQLHDVFVAEKIFCRILKTDGKAYHSHHMREAAQRYEDYLQTESSPIGRCLSNTTMFSTVKTGQMDDLEGGIPNSYWIDNLNSPVLFREGFELMMETMPDVSLIIEIGPHPALAGPIRQICQMKERKMTYLPSLERGKCDADQILNLAGNLWTNQVSLDLHAVTSVEQASKGGTIDTETGTLLVDLPPYHWTYPTSCLAESRLSKEHRNVVEPRHDILGRRLIGTSALQPVWRNILRQKDLPWLSQHVVGGEVIMPAAGYLALAVEAITQMNRLSEEPLEIQTYTVRDVIISSATVVPDDETGTETSFHLQPIDGKLPSQWYQFTASCCSYGAWKETARGKVALNMKSRTFDVKPYPFLDTTKKIDYLDCNNKLRGLGIDLGPAYHHIRTIHTDETSYTTHANMSIAKECGLVQAESRYILHPTVLDSCLQPALLSAYQGRLQDMRRAAIPTHFGEVTMFPPTTKHLESECTLQVRISHLANRAFASSSQLIAYDGSLLVDLCDCRQVFYEVSTTQEKKGSLQRDLYIKHEWKLDANYLNWADAAGALTNQPFTTIVDALMHKDVATRTLCFDNSLIPHLLDSGPSFDIVVATTSAVKETLEVQHPENRRISYTTLDVNNPTICTSTTNYDLIITTQPSHLHIEPLRRIHGLLTVNGRFLLQTSSRDATGLNSLLKEAGFSGIDCLLQDSIVLTTAMEQNETSCDTNGTHPSSNDTIILVYRDKPTPLLSTVSNKLADDGWTIRSEPINALSFTVNQRVVLLVDCEGPFLAQLQEEQLDSLIRLTESASSIIWVTCGGLLSGKHPEFAMTEGAARVIRNEKQSLDLVTLDFDVEDTSADRVATLVSDVAGRQRVLGRNGEVEYYMKDGAAYIGRLVSHREVNREFVPDSGESTTILQHDRPVVRAQFQDRSIVYRHDEERRSRVLDADEVEIHVTGIGLASSNWTDDAIFLNSDITGTVTRVGADVKDVSPGTNVAGLAFDRLATFQRTPCHLVQRIPQGHSMIEAAGMLPAFATAIYALEELARVEPGESVLIVDDMGATGLAAVQLCRISRVNAIVITSSKATEEFLLNNGLVSHENILYRSDRGLSTLVENATAEMGIDVMMCSTTADMAEYSWCLAPLGRVVVVGQSNRWDATALRPSSHGKGFSIFQFSLADVSERRPNAMASAIKRYGQLWKEGLIKPIGLVRTTGPRSISDAIQSIPTDLGSGRCTLSYDQTASFKVLPSPAPLTFKDNVTYLMAGGLGGLGRHVALWMADRGARRLAFLSRSGTDNPAAAETVRCLIERGVDVLDLRANITCREDVVRAIAEINPNFPVRGVVNAAAAIHDSLFQNMTMGKWHTVNDTKVNGALNLHHALGDEPLDFFVMTSSIASTLGSTGQSNYSAANSFLDSLARHRRSHGLAAVSLILPPIFGIGYISEHPEIEKSIKAKGMYGIDKREMLEAFEVAMRPHSSVPAGMDHIIVGIQPRRFGKAIREAGAYMSWKEDRRLNWMEKAVQEQAGRDGANIHSSQNVISTITTASSPNEALELTIDYLRRRLARLLMIDEQSIHTAQKSVANYGLDSMIGAEFRNWIFREFHVDVPFQQLLAGNFTVLELGKLLCYRIRDGIGSTN